MSRDMNEGIEPISEQWWSSVRNDDGGWRASPLEALQGIPSWGMQLNDPVALSAHLAPYYIALANHALPHGDGRKITPDTVRVLGEFLDRWRDIEKADADFNGYGRGLSHEAAYQLMRNLESSLRSILPPAAPTA